MTSGRRIGVSAASAAFLYSAAGLGFGNIPRLKEFFGYKMFHCSLGEILLIAAGIGVLAFLSRAASRRLARRPALDWRGAVREAYSLAGVAAASVILLAGAFLGVVVFVNRETFLLLFPGMALLTVAVAGLFVLGVLQRLARSPAVGFARAERETASLALAGATGILLLAVPYFISIDAVKRNPGGHFGLYALLCLIAAAVAAPLILAVCRRLAEPLTLVKSCVSRAAGSISLAGAAAGIFLAGWFWPAVGGGALARATEKVRDAGYPVEIPSVARKIPDEENGAFYYKRLNSLESVADMKVVRAETIALKGFLERASLETADASEYAVARRIIARHSEGLRLLEQAVARPRTDWAIPWDFDPIWDMPNARYFGMVLMVRVSAARAVLLAREGRHREALDSVRLGLIAARSLEHQGLLLGTLVRILLVNDALAAGRFVLRRAPPGRAEKSWGPLLDTGSIERGFWTALGREHFAEARWFSKISWWDIMFGKYRGQYVDRRAFGLELAPEDANRPKVLALLTCYWPFMKLDMASGLHGRLEIARTMRSPGFLTRGDSSGSVERAMSAMWTLANMSTRNYEPLQIKVYTSMANVQLARAAMAARRFKIKRGRWPRSIDELSDFSNEKYDDPFAGAPLRLSEEKARTVISSVGGLSWRL